MTKRSKKSEKSIIEKKMWLWSSDDAIKRLTLAAKNDKIAIVSTDTTLGFISNSTFKSFKKLNEIKSGREKKPYLLLIWPQNKLNRFVDTTALSSKQRTLITQCWPGPVTIIFEAKKYLPNFLQSSDGTIAIRCPNHKPLQALLESFDGLFSTSANRTEKPIPQTVDTIDPEIVEKINYLVIDSGRLLYQTLPSSIIDVSNRNVVRVVRKGAFPLKELEQMYGASFKKKKI